MLLPSAFAPVNLFCHDYCCCCCYPCYYFPCHCPCSCPFCYDCSLLRPSLSLLPSLLMFFVTTDNVFPTDHLHFLVVAPVPASATSAATILLPTFLSLPLPLLLLSVTVTTPESLTTDTLHSLLPPLLLLLRLVTASTPVPVTSPATCCCY